MHNIVVELVDGSIIRMNRVRLDEGFRQLWNAYGEEILSMAVEPCHKEPKLYRSYDLWGNAR